MPYFLSSKFFLFILKLVNSFFFKKMGTFPIVFFSNFPTTILIFSAAYCEMAGLSMHYSLFLTIFPRMVWHLYRGLSINWQCSVSALLSLNSLLLAKFGVYERYLKEKRWMRIMGWLKWMYFFVVLVE